MQISQQDSPAHFGLREKRFDAEPAFFVRAGSLFDDCKQGAHNSFGLWMMPLKLLAFKFLLTTVFQTLVRVFVGDNSVK